jgi:membrane-associated phospholipid phosphatase
VWRLTRDVLGSSQTPVWEWFYSVGWGAVFFISGNAVALYASRRFVGTFFTAMFASWLIGGCLMAYIFSAAGPVFAPAFDPALGARFGPLRDVLSASLGDSPIGFTQHYLLSAIRSHVAVKGGGISAMPSMHLAAASIYVLAARGTRWLSPAVLFWLIIFVASGYFGYHYWVDGIVAAIVAAACWYGADAAYSRIRVAGGNDR